MKFLICIFISLQILLPINSVFAQEAGTTQPGQESLGFSLSPAIVEIPANSGESRTAEVRFINNSGSPIAAKIEAETLIPIDTVIDQERRAEFDASSWISLENETLVFEPGELKTVPFTITVPLEANPGGHYAQLTLKPGFIQSGSNTQTRVLPQLSSSIFITVAGDVYESARFIDDGLDIGRVTRNSDKEVSFVIQNTGNTHILPSPRISVLKNGAVEEVISFQPQLILPNTEKTFTGSWSVTQGFGTYQIQAETTYGSAGIPLVSDSFNSLITPALWQIILTVLLLPIVLFVVLKRQNIPKAISVLTGRAHLKSANYRKKSDHKEHALPKEAINDSEAKEMGSELATSKPILNIATKPPEIVPSKQQTNNTQKEKPAPAPVQKPNPAPKVQEETKTATHIVQTKSSTIVREKPRSTEAEPTPIPVRAVKKAKAKKPKATKGAGKQKKSTGKSIDIV